MLFPISSRRGRVETSLPQTGGRSAVAALQAGPTRRFALLGAVALALAALALPPAARAQDWPSRPVTLVVPFPAGSATDVLARVLAEQLGRGLKQSVIVENKAGANGTIGTTGVARAAPDGYTLLVATSTTHAANASLYRRLQHDPIKDFAPVSRLAQIPFVMLSNPQVPAQNVTALVAYARQNPGKLAWGSGSSGSLIPGQAFVTANQLEMLHVPYKGVPPAIMDTVGGAIQVVFGDLSTAVPQVKGGKLRALAVTSARPHPMLPGIPPLSTVVPGFEMTAWFALYAPAGTPPAVIDKLNKAVVAGLRDPAAQQKLAPGGFEVTTSTPAELGLFAAKETVKWAKAVKEAGIPPME
ncbi:tripartite tricarboxylate transporter substrate binding protein [Aquabacterium sp. A7-Y]|uniref:Bug family tripartite tricarboxylate transporter substrate binding protein n=1 Tax=Aquabacterium sp. A7-Y TaxID=1349605 RepID=UPI00223D6EAD|nr:tripartite tricarboxylate transporter substrate binding protein [Aquabacterium sp. A7-Y]MCW7539623.1 tripartite tricarboxylate transporter substrate binding protein [Aquabacterium sp. A7-Y]